MSSGTFDETNPSLLELVLRLQGDFRRSLKPLGVTPLQAAVLSYLKNHPNSRLTPIAVALTLEPPTVFEVVQDLARKRWVSHRRSAQDRRALALRLNRQGETLVQSIADKVRNLEAALTKDTTRKALRSTAQRGAITGENTHDSIYCLDPPLSLRNGVVVVRRSRRGVCRTYLFPNLPHSL